MDQRAMVHLLLDEQVDLTAEWEARLFAIVASLVANNIFEWADLRAHIVRLNGALSGDPDDEMLSTDLTLWAYALRNLLRERGLLQ